MQDNSIQFEPATERTEAIARYEEMRYGMFIHFTMNTFLDQPFWETLKGPLPPANTYCPIRLDVDQWLAVAKKAGMRYAVLTAKHYLGFALWDSKYTDYDVAHRRDKGPALERSEGMVKGLRPGKVAINVAFEGLTATTSLRVAR